METRKLPNWLKLSSTFLKSSQVKVGKIHLTGIMLSKRFCSTLRVHIILYGFNYTRFPNISTEREKMNDYLFREDYSERGFWDGGNILHHDLCVLPGCITL